MTLNNLSALAMKAEAVSLSAGDRFLQYALLDMTQGLAGETGLNFFHKLTQSLAHAIQADYVLLGRLAEHDAQSVEMLSVFGDGKHTESFCYEIQNTPCAEAIARESCCYYSGVSECFPDDVVLQAMHGSAFIGVALLDSAQKPLGILAALWCDEQSADNHLPEQLLKLFAVRVSSEMERQRALDILKCQNEMLSRVAYEDRLTGLPNRIAFLHLASAYLEQNSGQECVIVAVDVARFREVNEGMGYGVGSLLLCSMAERIKEAMCDCQSVLMARLDGDRFALLLQGGETCFARVTQALQRSTHEPFDCDGVAIKMGFYVGGALYPAHGSNAEELLRCAEISLYAAKKRENHACLYAHSMDGSSKEKLLLLTDLRRALGVDELHLFYQPKKRAADGVIGSCEALLRWLHPEKGMIPPGDFIPLGENSELIHPITYRVMQLSLEQISRWLEAGKRIAVAINISAHNLMEDGFVSKVVELMDAYPQARGLLEMEITESTLMSDPKRAATVLHLLAAQHIDLAIDDFGTGYSSLAYLKKLPIKALKIDRSFVMDMDKDQHDRIIVKSTIDLAHNLGLSVVAEGVETQAQQDDLIRMGCDYLQGYFISRPLPAKDLQPLLDMQPILPAANFSI